MIDIDADSVKDLGIGLAAITSPSWLSVLTALNQYVALAVGLCGLVLVILRIKYVLKKLDGS